MRLDKINLLLFVAFFQIYSSGNSNYLSFIEAKKDCVGPLKFEFLDLLKKCFNVEVFIETGTYLGETSLIASNFYEVHTIELDKKLFNRAKNMFNDLPNLHLYHGDSKDVLDLILKKINKKILFFLDAHWSGGFTARGEENSPIIEELRVIKKNNIKNAIILIDDIRYFHSQDILRKENNEIILNYPTIHELHEVILDINPGYNFIIYGDIAIAYPKSENIKISPVIEAMTLSRMNDAKLISKEMSEAKEIIKNATYSEKAAISALKYHLNVNPILTEHYRLWNLLI